MMNSATVRLLFLILASLFSAPQLYAGNTCAGAHRDIEAEIPTRPDQLRLGLQNWNLFQMADGTEIGVAVKTQPKSTDGILRKIFVGTFFTKFRSGNSVSSTMNFGAGPHNGLLEKSPDDRYRLTLKGRTYRDGSFSQLKIIFRRDQPESTTLQILRITLETWAPNKNPNMEIKRDYSTSDITALSFKSTYGNDYKQNPIPQFYGYADRKTLAAVVRELPSDIAELLLKAGQLEPVENKTLESFKKMSFTPPQAVSSFYINSKLNLSGHFDKHGAKLGLKTVKDYEDQARSFALSRNPYDIYFVREDHIVKFNPISGYRLFLGLSGSFISFHQLKEGSPELNLIAMAQQQNRWDSQNED
jgi:hypothetical protein